MRLLITRPEAEAAAFSAQLEALGHSVVAEPLLQMELLPIETRALEGTTALIVTSRNGVRALAQSQAFDTARKLPMIAVGPGTASLARELGFSDIVTGPGTGAELVPIITAQASSLGGEFAHLRGDVVAFDLKEALAAHGIAVREILAYRSQPASALSPQTQALLQNQEVDAVILMSPRTGAIFTELVKASGLEAPARNLVLLCLSPAVAAAVKPLSPKKIEVAESPNLEAMLSVVARVATLWSGV